MNSEFFRVLGRSIRQEAFSGSSHNVELAGLKAGIHLRRIASASEVETLRLVVE
ncbi:MAG: hypothetical protein ABIY71_02210 [Flavobacteriales bacterium]